MRGYARSFAPSGTAEESRATPARICGRLAVSSDLDLRRGNCGDRSRASPPVPSTRAHLPRAPAAG